MSWRRDNWNDNDNKSHVIVQTLVRAQYEDLAEKVHVASVFWMR